MLPERRVQRWLYALFANFAIIIGATSYRYDFKRRLYTQTKWSQPIASLANLLVIVVISMDLYADWKSDTLETEPDKDLATGQTIRMDTTLNNVICLLRVLQRLPRERVTHGIAQELRRLQRIYRFGAVHRSYEEEEYLERILLLKHCSVWALLGFLMGFMQVTHHLFGIELDNVLSKRVMIVILVLAMDGQDVIMHLHFLFTWNICDSFMCLNGRIRMLLLQQRRDARSLHHLRWQHWQLGRLWHRLNVAYYSILISSRLSLIVTASALGFYISVFRSLDYHGIYQFMGFGLYAIIVLDCYMLDLMYDLTVSAYRESTGLLLAYNEDLHSDDQLARGVIRHGIYIFFRTLSLISCSVSFLPYKSPTFRFESSLMVYLQAARRPC